MDEYTASRTQVQTIVKAAQSMKDSLTCSICIDYFEKPVTIRCGHKFCHRCISEVANNDNASCPLCNTKIQKRSILKESSKQLELCVNQFKALAKAIYDDSGIDVLEPCLATKDSKESVLSRAKQSVSRIDEASVCSKGSLDINSKLRAYKKTFLQKKSVTPKNKTTRSTKNTLHKYLSSKSNCTSDEKVESQDKVESWLKCVEPADADNEDIDDTNKNIIEETDNDAISNSEDSPLNKNKYADEPSTSKSCFTEMKETCEKTLQHTYPSTSKTMKKYKETEMRIQEAELMAKKKKLNQGLADRAVLKTPSSVPAASHSDAQDWRRVKQVGKEMQVKTFKSLNVSKEKSSSSIALDDTVPCNLTNNDSKDVSRESDSNMNSSINVNVAVKLRSKKQLETNSKSKKLNYSNELQDQSYNHSMDSTNSHKEVNTSLSRLDSNQVNEIIGIQSAQYVKTPEKTRNVYNASKPGVTSKQKVLSPFKTNTNLQLQESELSSEESSNLDSKSTLINALNSPTKHRLSLRMKLSDSVNSKSTQSHISKSDKMDENKTGSPIKDTPERPKSKLSLRLQSSKPVERKLNLKKSPQKNQNSICTDKNKPARSPNSKIVVFKKLGKIGKKLKYIPFRKLGRLCPRVTTDKTGIKIKSNENINIDLSRIKAKRKVMQTNNEVKMLLPEEDSQLKHFVVEASLHSETRQTNVPMEIDESLPKVTIVTSREKEIINDKTVLDKGETNNRTADLESIPSTINLEETKESMRTNVRVSKFDNVSSKTCKNVMEDIDKTNSNNYNISENTTNTYEYRPSKDAEKDKMDKNVDILINDDLQRNINTAEVQDDAISISSNDSGSRNLQIDDECSDLDRKNKHSEVESVTSESSLIYEPKHKKELDEKNSVCSSRLTSPLRTLPLKKKRKHSELSNDDDDDDDDVTLASIIGKWTSEKPAIKKPKVSESNPKNVKESRNESSQSENFDSDDNEKTLAEDGFKETEFAKPQRDPPIDDIISKVKSFKEVKENDYSVSKLTGLPSSLQSADLFESNDPITRVRVETNKQSNEITSDNSSVHNWSFKKKSDKENQNDSFEAMEVEPEKTIVDLLQFERKKSNNSICSNSSNKENNACNKVNIGSCYNMENLNESESSPNQKRIAEKNHDSPLVDSYHVPDTLINITQEQLALKMIEKDLMGDPSTVIRNENKDAHENNTFATPRRKVANLRVCKNYDDDFDSENIDATPVATKRRRFNICQSKSTVDARINSSDISSPEKNVHLIPAVTPVRNTKSYPLSHSTPMIETPSPEKESRPQVKPMALICSGLVLDNVKIVQSFAKKFDATFLSTFSNDVTHVIVATDPVTNVGQKTFKYIQGIAFKKFVINFQWILDCLDENTLLDEDDEKYDVLDPDILECGSRRSRRRIQELFERFAFFCLEPFNSISLKDFKHLLVNNGAVITSTAQELSLQKDKFRVILLECEELSPKKLTALKKLECIIVSFEWVVDSISQYQIVSLFPYLFETKPEEAIAVGFPASYLKEEEEEEEEEE